MEDDLAKNLIQKSTINTSEDFTDKLLLKIETEKAAHSLAGFQHIRMYRYALFGIVGVGIVFFTLIYLGFLPKLNIFNFHLKINKIPLIVIATLLLLLGANHILKIQHLVNFQHKN